MHFILKYDYKGFTGLVIAPDEKEDPDLLYDYAQTLRLRNPALTFADIAKAGTLNDLSEMDYRRALEKVKTVSRFFDNRPDANVFHVLAEAINYILSGESTSSGTEQHDEHSQGEDQEREEEEDKNRN